MKKATVKKQALRQIGQGVLVIVAALAVLSIDAGFLRNANADVRVRARVHTPYGSVEYSNGPHYRNGYRYDRNDYRITRYDRKIARRLSRATRYSKHRLLKMRRRGLSWNEIGWRLDIAPRTVRWAIRGRSDDRRGRDYDHYHGNRGCNRRH